jgi:hypothetical protein
MSFLRDQSRGCLEGTGGQEVWFKSGLLEFCHYRHYQEGTRLAPHALQLTFKNLYHLWSFVTKKPRRPEFHSQSLMPKFRVQITLKALNQNQGLLVE